MRAITIDNDILEYDDAYSTVGEFRALYGQDVRNDDEDEVITVMLDPVTYAILPDAYVLDRSVVYLFLSITDTLLHRAVEKQYVKLVDFLLQNGVDVDSTDEDERTALSYSYDPDIATLLIQGGADVNHSDIDDNTPMHHLISALIREMTRMIDMDRLHSIVRTLHVLSWNGADPDLPNEDGITPRELYHGVFPETEWNDEDPELRTFFSSSSSSSSSSCSYACDTKVDDDMKDEEL